MVEVYRQLAFVSSVLGGFAITFFAMMLATPHDRRLAPWAAVTSLAAAIGFLIVTLGSTFGAAVIASLPAGAAVPEAVARNHRSLSVLFLAAIYILLTSFGLSGYTRSTRMGMITLVSAVLGALAVGWVMSPFLS